MHRRQAQSRSFSTTLAIALLIFAAVYQLYTRGLPDQVSAEAVKIEANYDVGAAREALNLFRAR